MTDVPKAHFQSDYWVCNVHVCGDSIYILKMIIFQFDCMEIGMKKRNSTKKKLNKILFSAEPKCNDTNLSCAFEFIMSCGTNENGMPTTINTKAR